MICLLTPVCRHGGKIFTYCLLLALVCRRNQVQSKISTNKLESCGNYLAFDEWVSRHIRVKSDRISNFLLLALLWDGERTADR